jgi:hypothetical protein
VEIPVLGSPTKCLKDLDRSLDRAVDLFAENATFEFPLAAMIGLERRFLKHGIVSPARGLFFAKQGVYALSANGGICP